MREMKESGLEWVGRIPTEWRITKGKYFMNLLERPVYEDDGVITCFRDGEVTLRANRREDGFTIATVEAGYQGIEPGDLVVHGMDGFAGAIGISDSRGKGTPALNVLDCAENKRYVMYYLRAMAYGDVFTALATGIRVRTCDTNWKKLRGLEYIIPTFEEQQRIVSYLDQKCSEVNNLITDIQSEINILEQYKRSVITETVTKGLALDVEMKDSGIQWIGMMPSHWECIRGKYILKYIQKPVCEGDGVITCFRDGEVTLRSNRREDGFTMADKEIGYQGIDVGDLVVHGMDGFAGAIGISDSRGKASPVLNVLDTEQNKRYIMYFLRSMAYSDVFLAMATGIRVRSCDLRWNKLAELFYPVPPIEEQEAIVAHIDSVLTKTNDVIAAKKEQLSVLEAYKKSLIFEYVTGKKEVPVPITAVMVDPNVILLGKLPKLLSEQKGKIYNQKVLYLLNIYLGLNLDVQYYRYKHGPYDLKLDSYIDTLTENGWCVKIDNNGAENLGIGPNYGAFEEKFGSHFSEYDAEINKLIQFVQPMKRTQLERVATLFAVWNDMILDGNSAPTDAEIISEVMSGWTENKANSAYETWLNTLNKMKLHHIVPKGQGLHTLPKDRCTNGYIQEGGAKA